MGVLNRFVDTTSGIDIVGFKHSFTNLPGTENPTFSAKFFNSSAQNAATPEWQQIGYVQSTNNIVFLTDVKRYLKVVLEFSSESDISNSNFLFLIQVNIDDISVPVITDHARSVLSRFPSWTKMYSDSLEKATPSIALPESKAGLMVNALLGEDLDNAERLISDIDLDSFISTADINQVAWLYVVPSVRPGFIKAYGDGVELGRVSSYVDLLDQGFNDFVFYYDFITQDLYSIKPYNKVTIDGIDYSQVAVQNYNSFDELGLRVGLQRLYLESNLNFKKRILDVYKNPPSVDIEGLKRTLRRELDIWRAYGATPDSNYPGATPEILEISDFEKYGSDYFSNSGTPSDDFYKLVENLNVRFPANFGYAKWNETYWDYAGREQEGVSSIPQVTDINHVSTPKYQAGIGDFDDLKIIMEPIKRGVEKYSFGLKAKGIKSDAVENAYEPIKVAYDTYITYYEPYSENQSATVNYEIFLKLKNHGLIPNGAVYKATVRDYVKNANQQSHPSSPEYKVREIFNGSLFSSAELNFINTGGTPYYNVIQPSATESYIINQIPIYAVDQATVNYLSATNEAGATANYAWIRFTDGVPGSLAQSSSTKISKTITQQSADALRLAISSRIWDPTKVRIAQTDKVRSFSSSNILNQSGNVDQTNSIVFTPADIKKNFLLPFGADPIYVHIDNVVTEPYQVDFSSSPNSGYGGVSRNRENQVDYLIPSSPNIIAGFVNPGFATPNLHENYIGTSGATVSYYFTKLKFPYDATPGSIFINAASTNYYPFKQKVWTNFEAAHNNEFDFFLSENGVESSTPNNNYDILNNVKSNLVDVYSFYRSDFGLEEYDTSENMIVKSIEIVNENDNVLIWQENENDPTNLANLNFLEEASGKYILKDIKVRAQYDFSSEKNISPSIRSGWYYQNGEERYVYAKPKKKVANNNYEINLEEVARGGAPIIVDVQQSGSTPTQYRRVSFYDEATPHVFSDYNFEYIIAKNIHSLHLAYENVYNVSVTDTFTGETIISNAQSSTNEINIFQITTGNPLILGRSYKVTYKVRNAFYVDNQDYDSLTDEYQTKVYLLSTPNGAYAATVSYESALYDRDQELPEMKLNPLYTPVDEGYIYLSHEVYKASEVDAIISPRKIFADGIDYTILNVFSKDEYGNPKPHQTFSISGPSISATPSYVTTNEDGFGQSKIKYSGAPIIAPLESFVQVYGLDAATPNAHVNSSSGGLSDSVKIYLQPVQQQLSKIMAETNKKIVNANGLETLQIYGSAEANKKVYWRKSRTLRGAMALPYSTSASVPGKSGVSGMVESASNGIFQIGDFIAQNDATPGYWFVIVDTENASTPNSNPVTITGDIVYWYEKYDANQNNTEEPYYIPIVNESSDYVAYNEDPVFKVDPITGDTFYDSTPQIKWNIPKWYPIRRFTQYQLGLLGSTPNIVSSFSALRPDYEEE